MESEATEESVEEERPNEEAETVETSEDDVEKVEDKPAVVDL
jgi:hypothetical protein